MAQSVFGRCCSDSFQTSPQSVTSRIQRPLHSRLAAWAWLHETRSMAATCRCSGLLQGPGQLFDLAAVDPLQSASCGLAELGVQGAAEVADLHTRQGLEADNDPAMGGRAPVCMRSHVPPPPPEVRASLHFQVSVGFGVVRLLSLRDGLLGPELRVWPLLRLSDGSVLPRSKHMVPTQVAPAKGLLSHPWVTFPSPGRDSWVFRLM